MVESGKNRSVKEVVFLSEQLTHVYHCWSWHAKTSGRLIRF